MMDLPTETTAEIIEQNAAETSQAKIDKIADRVTTAVVATTIVQTGRGVFTAIAKSPWAMFGLGVATGYWAHKYRKEIIALSSHAAEQGEDFLHRQRQGLQKLLGHVATPESEESSD